MKILILGGIKEAVALAGKLIEEGHDVTSSLAGRTKEPKSIEGKVRIGGFGGVDGLVDYIKSNGIELMIDCTHPFAKQISANALEASRLANVKLDVHTREPWKKQSGEHWLEVKNLEEAREAIPKDARVLLALGRQYIDLFQTLEDVFFLVRMVDQPEHALPLPNHQLLIGKPSSDWRDEATVLVDNDITHIVCRNSGGTGAYAKIEAARNMKLPVIMVGR
jgi:precorrin-6A/cobalt-precorrin-6A reductase